MLFYSDGFPQQYTRKFLHFSYGCVLNIKFYFLHFYFCFIYYIDFDLKRFNHMVLGTTKRISIMICMVINTLNTLRPRENGGHFADDILKCIFLNENVWIPIEISLKFVPKGPIDNIPALV